MKSTAPSTERIQDPVVLHSLEVFELFEYFRVDPEMGLSQPEAAQRGERWGLNELVRAGSQPARPVLQAAASPWGWIPAAAALFCFAAHSWAAGATALAVALVNFWLYLRVIEPPQDPLPSLRKLVPPAARVRREGRVQEIESSCLVPGDVISLEAGDTVPADARLFESVNFRVRETTLTGENRAVEKVPQALTDKPLPVGDRTNLVFMGTTVLQGRGRAVVINTGMQTELGRMAEEIQTAGRENTPFQAWLVRAGSSFVVAASGGAVLILGVSALRGSTLIDALQPAAAFLLAIFPSGLLAAAAAHLALGARRISPLAEVRRLAAVDTLGSLSYVLTRQGQILTEPRTVVQLVDAAGNQTELELDLDHGQPVVRTDESRVTRPWPAHALLLAVGSLASSAFLEQDPELPGQFVAVGDPTEAALVAAAAKYGLAKGRLDRLFPRLIHSPLSGHGTRVSSLHGIRLTPHTGPVEEPLLAALGKGTSSLVTCVGSIPDILEASSQVWLNQAAQPLEAAPREAAAAQAHRLERAGMRSLAVAMRPLRRVPPLVEDYPHPLHRLPGGWDLPSAPGDVPRSFDAGDELERDLILVGFIGIYDPPRPGVPESIQGSRAAGTRLAMFSDDRPQAAVQVARSLDLHHGNPVPRVLTGGELQRLPRAELDRIVERVDVFSQLSPAQRLDVLRALRRRGQVAAVTGAAVHDAPAMRSSSLGIALTGEGTETIQAFAGLVLRENNLTALSEASAESRRTSRALLGAARVMLAGSLAVSAVILVTFCLGFPPVLGPFQVLWLSLVCSTLPALASAVPPPAESNPLLRPANRRNPWARLGAAAVLPAGLVAAAALVFAAWAGKHAGGNTAVFSLLAFILASRGMLLRPSSWLTPAAGMAAILLQLAAIYWMPAQAVFGTTALPPADLAAALLLGAAAAAAWTVIDRPAARKTA